MSRHQTRASRNRVVKLPVQRNNLNERCQRCQGLLWPSDFLNWARRPQDPILSYRCLACGDMVDQLIIENRLKQKRKASQTHRPDKERIDIVQAVMGF